jgi:hypothetical protein
MLPAHMTNTPPVASANGARRHSAPPIASLFDTLRPVSGWQAGGVFAVLTVLFTWPQVIHPLSIPDNIDTYFSMWRIAWIAHQLPRDPLHLFDGNIFYPLRHTLAYSDAVLLEGLAGAPLIWLGLPTVLVYNVLILAGFVACGVGMFLLVREVTGSGVAGLLGGIVFTLAPYRFDHYVHLEMVWAQWMPLALWMLHRTLTAGRLRDGLWTGLFVALQGLSCVYYAVFFATALVVAGPLLLFSAARAMRRRAAVALVAGAVLAAVLLLPYMRVYQSARENVGERERLVSLLGYSVGPKHYLASMPNSVLYGRLTEPISQHEKRLFPGLLVILLAGIGVWPPLNRTRIAYAAIAAIAIDISFAQRGLLLGWLYDHVFVYRGLRVPGRFGQLMLLGVGVLAGIGVTRAAAWLRERRPRWVGPVVGVTALVMLLEYLMFPMALVPVDTAPGPAYAWLRQQPEGVVAELPVPREPWLGLHEGYYEYESTFHWFPLLNGYSGHYPDQYIFAIRAIVDFPSPGAIEGLRSRGVKYVLVRQRFYEPGEYRAIVTKAGARADLAGYGPFADGPFEVRVYRVLPGTGRRPGL